MELISLRGRVLSHRYALWIVLLVGSGVPRILAAFLLPNEEVDPYAYVRAIDMMRDSIVGGTFTMSELFGFWLPLYQFVCALISIVVGHPLYVAKLVSAVCGTGVCLIVFAVSMKLTANRRVSLLAFALIALNPIHIMYSAFSMSDVPHALLVMSSLYFALTGRWMAAAGFAAAGGLTRPESWLFIGLLPALQWLLHRRVSLTGVLLTLSAPLIWIYISWAATGNPLEYFKVRNDYITDVLAGNPDLASFSQSQVVANLQTFLYSTGHAVMIACVIAAWLVIKSIARPGERRLSDPSPGLVVTVGYFFSSLGFLLFVYFTKNQPAIYARYCLVLFALGLPVLAWVFLAAIELKPAWTIRFSVLLGALCLWPLAFQLRDGASYINQVLQKRIVAGYLNNEFQGDPNLKVFCDDDTVKILADIPGNVFRGSSDSPDDAKSFLEYLRENRVEYLVYERRDGSSAEKLFRDLGEKGIKDHFQLVAPTNTDLRLYRTTF